MSTTESCNAAHIAAVMNIDKSYLSRIITSHVKNGYIQRTPSNEDGRSYALFLTGKGKQQAEELIHRSDNEIGNLLQNLSKAKKTRLADAFDTITELFILENEDIKEMENIEAAIESGGQIFFAIDDNEEVMACCMIAPREDGDWEIMKFAAKGMYTGTGAGSACLKACMDYAKEKHVEKIIIVSNRKCVQAVHLYRKFGFQEIPVDKKRFLFERADIAFEQIFDV